MKGIEKGVGRWLKRRTRTNTLPSLGSREIDVLKLLWREGELTAQQALSCFANEQITLSTLQSTLERLHRKSLVNRQKTGRFYTYTAAISQSHMISHLLYDITDQISDGDMAPMISGFMSFVGDESVSDEEASKKGASNDKTADLLTELRQHKTDD